MTVAHVYFAIILLLLCYLIFSAGRIYECSVAIREREDKMMELRREMEKIDDDIAKLGGGEGK